MPGRPMPGGNVRTEVTRRGYGERIKSAVLGVVGGFALIAAAFALLWWNEGRAIKTTKGLAEGAAVVVSVSPDSIEPANNGRLIHVTGHAASLDILRDPLLGIEEPAIALIREAEMYQWKQRSKSERRSRAGGSEERVTTYTYHPEWSAGHVDSSRFHDPAFRNPSSMPVPVETFHATNVSLGEFRLNQALIGQIGDSEPYGLNASHVQGLPERLRGHVDDEQPDWLYLGDAYMPEVGDLRLRMRVVRDQPVSVVARQIDNTFEPYITDRGTVIQRLVGGVMSTDAMFSRMERENVFKTWGLRALGLVMMIAGIGLVLKPIQVVFDVLPLLGSLAGLGTGLIALVFGLVLSLMTIAGAWLFYRPLLSAALIALCVGTLMGAKTLARGRLRNS